MNINHPSICWYVRSSAAESIGHRNLDNYYTTQSANSGYYADGRHNFDGISPFREGLPFVLGIKVDDAKIAEARAYYDKNARYRTQPLKWTSQWALFVNMYLLPDGSFTEIHPDVCALFDEPIDLPMGPALTSTGYRGIVIGNTIGNIGSMVSTYRGQENWVDSRGTIAFLGSRYNRTILATKRKRIAMVAKNWKKKLNNEGSGFYRLRRQSPSQLIQLGRFFLYRQRVLIYDPYTRGNRISTFVGLATTANLNSLGFAHGEILNLTDSLKSLEAFTKAHKVWASQQQTVHPLNRHARIWKGDFSDEEWTTFAAIKAEQYGRKPSPELLSFMNAEMAIAGSPMAMMVKRLEKKNADKELELKELKAKLDMLEANRKHNRKVLKDSLKEFYVVQKRIQSIKRKLPEITTSIVEIQPQVSRTEVMSMRIRKAVQAKKKAFEKRKADYRAQLCKEDLPDYNAGLAKSGIQITELIYQHVNTGQDVSASVKPSVTTDSNYTLVKAFLQTNRPIKIEYGIGELAPRASGPHEMEISGRADGGGLNFNIRPLYPWSVIGIHKDGEHFKCYPHTGWKRLRRDSAERFTGSLESWSNVCLGMLADTASKSFRNNNPRQLALALLSYLKSADPADEWGQAVKRFPKWDDIQPKVLQPQPTPAQLESKLKERYYIDQATNRFSHYTWTKDAGTCRWGDLMLVDDLLTEVSSSSEPVSPTSRRRGGGSRKGYRWQQQFTLRPAKARRMRVPAWHPETQHIVAPVIEEPQDLVEAFASHGYNSVSAAATNSY